ncbi:MAG: glycosyltransferase [Ilumatobacteraceae bacterium]
MICAGVRGRTPDLTHHGIWYSGDYRREYDEIGAGRLPDDPTIYACISSVTDATQAPTGDENWFVLVNVPSGAVLDRQAATAHVLERLAGHGVDLRDRLAFTETITPPTSSTGSGRRAGRSTARRPTGGVLRSSGHATVAPGEPLPRWRQQPSRWGLPLVTLGARIVDDDRTRSALTRRRRPLLHLPRHHRSVIRRTARVARHLVPAPTPWSVAWRCDDDRDRATSPAARRRPPLGLDDAATAAGLHEIAGGGPELPTISVVVPARDEARRIGPLLAAVVGAPGVSEVLVVDDESTDGTAELVTAAGAVVVPGTQLPHGWAGKAWAVHQGCGPPGASGWSPSTPTPAPTPSSPSARQPGAGRRVAVRQRRRALRLPDTRRRLVAPGAAHHARVPVRPTRDDGTHCRTGSWPTASALSGVLFLRAGGLQPVAGEVVEDVALARHLAAGLAGHDARRRRVAHHRDVSGRSEHLARMGARWHCPASNRDGGRWSISSWWRSPRSPLPPARCAEPTSSTSSSWPCGPAHWPAPAAAYRGGGAAYWLSPLADAAAVAALVRGSSAPRQPWRGRSYASRVRT